MPKKKKPSILWRIFCLLLLVYLALYIALESGYYETKMSNYNAHFKNVFDNHHNF